MELEGLAGRTSIPGTSSKDTLLPRRELSVVRSLKRKLQSLRERYQALRAEVKELRRLVRTYELDPLTKVYTRQAGMRHIGRLVEQAREDGCGVTIIFLDCDRLKAVNDTMKHSAGDRYLRTVGQLLRGYLTGKAAIVRWGGDEFVCAVPSSDTERIQWKLKSMRKELARRGKHIPYAVSVGLSELHPNEKIARAIDRADSAMYQDKLAHRA
ncbi:MAG: GGDEF domain-containing protein [Candidatus Dormibacteria bacterium]